MIFFMNIYEAKKNKHLPVYRWWNSQSQQYNTISGSEFSDRELTNNGWTDKTLLYNSYNGVTPNSVAVYNWYNPVSKTYVSVPESEFTDEQMTKRGYGQKHLQYYALTHTGKKAKNHLK